MFTFRKRWKREGEIEEKTEKYGQETKIKRKQTRSHALQSKASVNKEENRVSDQQE